MDGRGWQALMVASAVFTAALPDWSAAQTGPWDLRKLRAVPRHEVVAVETVREAGKEVTLSSLLYEGETWMGKPTRVFAYYAVPKAAGDVRAGKLPAMVLVHGGGGTAFPQWARLWAARGYAAIAMDLSGNGAERKRLTDGGPDQGDEWKFRRLKDGVTNAWSYHAVAAVIRAHSLLRSMPEVDRNRTGITGISWGGYLTSIVMSLDDRFKVAAPVYGCGYLHENSVWLPTFASLSPADRATWVEQFDPSRYLPNCRIPVLWVNGTNDFAYPLDSYQKSYRAVAGPRTLCVRVKMPHGHEAGWAPGEIGAFVDAVLRKKDGERGLALVTLPQVSGSEVRVGFDSSAAVARVGLHWTADLKKPWQERDWQTVSADVLNLSEAKAELPSARPLVFFMTVTDSRGYVTSTEHVELR